MESLTIQAHLSGKWIDIEDLPFDQQDFIVLKYGTISPVGNLRMPSIGMDFIESKIERCFS